MKDLFVLNSLVKHKKLLVSFAALISSSVSLAQSSYSGSVSNSLGGTGVAAVRAEESAFLNPATLVHSKGYKILAAYRDMDVKNDGSIYNTHFHLSESRTQSLFSLGVTYLKTRNFYSQLNETREDIHLTTGAFILPTLSIGLDVYKSDYEALPVTDEEWNGSLGVHFVPMPNLGIGYVYRNLRNSSLYYMARSTSLGLSYLFGNFLRAHFDVDYQVDSNPDNELLYMLGLEHLLTDMLELRTGLRFDDFGDNNFWTLGLGFNGPKLGLNYAFEKNFSEVSEYAHTVDLRLQF